MKRYAVLARSAVISSLFGMGTLHLLPNIKIYSSKGEVYSYDPRFNFLSEYVRTQYGSLMIFVFLSLALSALALGGALWKTELRREAVSLGGASVFLILLAFFRTDLVDLRTDAITCGDPTRIEPCTILGRIHNPLSTVVFGFVFLVAVSLFARRTPKLHSIAWGAVVCGALALFLVVVSFLYLRSIGYTARAWVGLMQRALVLPTLLWLWWTTKKIGVI